MKKYVLRGSLLGCLIAFLVWLAERTTGDIAWGLIISFPVFWGFAGYLFWRWHVLPLIDHSVVAQGESHAETHKR